MPPPEVDQFLLSEQPYCGIVEAYGSSRIFKNLFALFLGIRCISNESPFQVVGPTIENVRRCLVEVVAQVQSEVDQYQENEASFSRILRISDTVRQSSHMYASTNL